jgi:hypothetical protein
MGDCLQKIKLSLVGESVGHRYASMLAGSLAQAANLMRDSAASAFCSLSPVACRTSLPIPVNAMA